MEETAATSSGFSGHRRASSLASPAWVKSWRFCRGLDIAHVLPPEWSSFLPAFAPRERCLGLAILRQSTRPNNNRTSPEQMPDSS